jgi:hypothetical protein
MVKGITVVDPVAHFLGGLIVQPSGHWRYGLQVNSEGYASICFDGEKHYAHRFSCELYNGPIPFGFDVDHLCRLRWCVAPMHLQAVPRSVNIRRAYRECKRGHDLEDPANYYTRKNGGRLCKPCNNLRNSRR